MKPILVVEDEVIMRESLRDWLKNEGYEVETAEQGEEALQRIGEVDFGVLVLDLKLPGKDGLEVLKEARAKRPHIKGIIITAYPSVETKVEAMKIGVLYYLPKPFAPDALEKLIRETLGPVQVELKPKATIKEARVEAPAVEEAKVEEVIAITEEDIQVHLEQGKDHFKAKRYGEAVREFQAILDIAPADIKTRIWIRKAKEELSKPRIEVPEGEVAVEEAVKPKECVWMKLGVVSYRLCTHDYDCLNCEFDQQMQERMASGEAPEIEEAMERFKELPGNQRLCRYALRGEISYRLCTHLFQCATCEFGQIMEDALQRKIAKLAVRREALRKKEKRGKVEA